MTDTLLIIEDETLLGTELQRHFRRNGWDVTWAKGIAEAERLILQQQIEPLVVLADMSLPDGNSLDLLQRLRAQQTGGEWIFLTGYGTVPDSVRALRLGAFDFLTKPCDIDRLDVVIAGAARSGTAQRRLREEAAERSRRYSPASFVGRSQAARQVRGMLAKLTEVPFSALVVTGDTGTGKGLAARILHHGGPRNQGPLIEVNCAALPRELMEAELFGHEPGAFTGARGRRRGLVEQANEGTLFLDEIAELEPDLQAKLLKAIEDRTIRRVGGEHEVEVDIQIVAATNRDLEAEIREGRFRADLYHRLSVFHLDLPALHERTEDVQDLVPLFIAEFNAKANRHVTVVPDEVWNLMRDYGWPGNVRELRNVVERCVLFANNEIFPAHWLQLPSPSGSAPTARNIPLQEADRICLPLDGSMALDDMDQHIIQAALERHHYNVTATARALGTTRETLRYRIAKYGLEQQVARGRR